MKKLIVFVRRIFSGSFKRMFRNIQLVHRESGKSSLWIFADMLFSMIVYGTGYLDYLTFGFAFIGREKRKTFMTMNDNITLHQRLNDKDYRPIFEDKRLFYQTFSSYLGRSYLNLKETTPEKFSAFCQNKTSAFVKNPCSFGGLGVRKIHLSESTDYQALLLSLQNDGYELIEDTLLQHETMNQLCANSINTLRIVTLTDKTGTPHVAYTLLRVGNGTKEVDNITSGGLYTIVGQDGVLHFPAFCDKTVSYYEKHPMTGTPFIGFEIPYYHEATELCLEAARKVPKMRYIGWDIAITPTGPCFVEGNSFPGYDMPQNHRFCADGTGIKPLFEDLLQEKI